MKYYSTAQAADELGFAQSTLSCWAARIPNLYTFRCKDITLFTDEDLSFIRMVRDRMPEGSERGLLTALAYACSLKNPVDARPHYTPAEVARKLGYKTSTTIYRWIHDGKVHPVYGDPNTMYIFDAAGLAECIDYKNRYVDEAKRRRAEGMRHRRPRFYLRDTASHTATGEVKFTVDGSTRYVSREEAKRIVSEIMSQM